MPQSQRIHAYHRSLKSIAILLEPVQRIRLISSPGNDFRCRPRSPKILQDILELITRGRSFRYVELEFRPLGFAVSIMTACLIFGCVRRRRRIRLLQKSEDPR